jgi:hypothetical protein
MVFEKAPANQIGSLIQKSAAFALGLTILACAARAQEMFPFVIPATALPPSNSIVDVSWLNAEPAGKNGFVTPRDGHFADGAGKRIRFLGVNFTFASAFPSHQEAEKIAARLSSLGINVVRFHHMDHHWAPNGIWKRLKAWKNVLDPDQLDRLDYFIAQLKARGIYSDLNLHVSRNYWEGDDFPDGLTPEERQAKLPSFGKGLDMINDHMIAMQRDYARALLSHFNPYTKTAYAKEPAVAMVEINNENSLLQLNVADLPEYYRNDILGKWNAWLKARYGSADKLTAAWGGSVPLGDNLAPGNWTGQGMEDFTLSQTNGEVRVSLTRLAGESWHAQIYQLGLTLQEGRVYTLEFSARSSSPRKLPVDVRLQNADWHNCGLSETAVLGNDWRAFSYGFRAVRVEPSAVRVGFVLGQGPMGDFSIRDLTLRSGGDIGLKPGESLEAGTIGEAAHPESTPRHTDWIRFLAGTERVYAAGMRDFLKKDLGVRANIIESQASYGELAGCYRESANDYVDMHSYWQHPRFPRAAWDRADWLIDNTPLTGSKEAGASLGPLGFYRVAGRPFAVSEYDHPAPSHYSAEMFPMLASFGAVQDWDALFQFDYGGTNRDSGRIDGFFSLQQHPGKLAFLPAAALMFRHGDVSPAAGVALLSIPANGVDELMADGVSMADAWKQGGVRLSESVGRRFSVRFAADKSLASPRASRTGESGSAIDWDSSAGLYTVDAPAAKAVVGRCAGRTTRLTDAEFDVQPNARHFAVLTLSAADSKPLASSRRLLLVAAGNVENTGMRWNANHTSVGADWGAAPTLCEGIGAKVTLTTDAKDLKVFVLDASGARAGEVPATLAEGRLTFEIGTKFRTLWYEIAPE